MNLKKLWPARSAAQDDTAPVADLDAIVAEPVRFRFKGKVHTIKPVSLEEFLKFTNAQAALMEFLKSDDAKELTPKELATRYQKVIGSVCDTISIDDILGMEQVQVAALYQLVIDQVTGQVQTGPEASKKKRQKIPLYESVQHSSSQNAPGNSGGPEPKH